MSDYPRLRDVMLNWAVVYPLITVLLWLGEPCLAASTLPLRTFLLTAFLVPLMSYVAMPVVRRWI